MNHQQRLQLFDEVKAGYNGFLVSVLWKLTGDRELFADAMQYALLSIWRNIDKLNKQTAAGYIYRVALSANSKAWRNRISRDGRFSPEIAEAALDKDEKNRDFEAVYRLRKAIAGLPHRQSRALVMRYFEQKDYETIAGVLNCSVATTRSHVSKALSGLKREFSNE
jgi:RNA polymerase sigma factor (sigma-70 family)